jgi:hypothetical protein
MTYALWTVQIVLALMFLFAGGTKLVLPDDVLTNQFPLPALLIRFVGLAEFLGALGLVLPGLLRIRPNLTPLAALGLLPIMIGAIVITISTMGLAPALVPFIVGLLASFVAFGRWQLAPQRARPARRAVLQPAAL